MEKKRNSGLDATENIFKSITVTSPFRTIYPISHHPQDYMPRNPSPSASIPNVKTHPAAHHLKTKKNKKAAEGVDGKSVDENMDVTFTDYINRAKIKIRPTSSVNGKSVGDGSKSSVSGKEDGEDEFSDYINHAKMKMLRTMTNFTP